MLGLSWKVLLVLFGIWSGTLWLTRYISLASILAAVALPISLVVFSYPTVYVIFGIMLGAFVIGATVLTLGGWRRVPSTASARRLKSTKRICRLKITGLP